MPSLYEGAVLSLAALLGSKLSGNSSLSVPSKALQVAAPYAGLLPRMFITNNPVTTLATNVAQRFARRLVPGMLAGTLNARDYEDKNFKTSYEQNSLGTNLAKTVLGLAVEQAAETALRSVSDSKLHTAIGPQGAESLDKAKNIPLYSPGSNTGKIQEATKAFKEGVPLSNIWNILGVDFIRKGQPFMYTPDPKPALEKIKRPNSTADTFSFRLNDVLQNKELQGAYPRLADERMTFTPIPADSSNVITRGKVSNGKTFYNSDYYIDPQTGEVKNNRAEELNNTMYHELLHRIALREGWPFGATPLAMQRNRKSLLQSFEDQFTDWGFSKNLAPEDIAELADSVETMARIWRRFHNKEITNAEAWPKYQQEKTNIEIMKRVLNIPDTKDREQLDRFIARLNALTFTLPNENTDGTLAYRYSIGERLARLQGYLATHPEYLLSGLRPMENNAEISNRWALDYISTSNGYKVPTQYLYHDFYDKEPLNRED